jgi:hypothetical protein
MTPLLRASSLATLAATMLSFGSPQGAFADGRGNWQGYAWKTIEIADCRPVDTYLACPPYHQKWDWKRNQWVDISVSIDLATQKLYLSQQLTDKDSYDDDYVCVTALIVDTAGTDLVAHHQNWHMMHGDVVRKDFAYTSARLADADKIYIGSKQCRDGAGQDDDVYTAVLAGISS